MLGTFKRTVKCRYCWLSFITDSNKKSVIIMNLNNSQNDQSKLGKFAYAIIKMPDGTQHEIPLAPKQFKTGREGYYAQIPSFIYNDNMYGGQIQIWKKTK
jgi:hypothetical protein